MKNTPITYFVFILFCLTEPLFAFSQKLQKRNKTEELIDKAEEMLKADPSRAICYSNSAIVEAQKTNDNGHVAMAMATLGEAYMNQGDFDIGFESITNALEICPSDSALLRAYIYVRLSSSYSKLRDLDKAFEYVDKAPEIYKAAYDSVNLAGCYNVRGLVNILVPDNKKAEENFKAALAINRQLKAKKLVAANLNNLCLYEGNTQEKIAMLLEAIAINDSLGAVWSLGENYNNLGTQYFYAKQYPKALEALKSAKRYAQQINAKELISDNYRYTSWVYEAQKNYQEAYTNLLNFYNTEQVLLAKDKMRQIELNIIQKRMHTQEQKMTVKEEFFQIKNLQMWRFIAILSGIAILFISLYVIFHFRQLKRIQALETTKKLDKQEKELIALKLQRAEDETYKAQQELNYNREELTNFAFFIRSRNDLLANIQSMIKEGYKLSNADAERYLRNINTYISQFNAQNTETELLIDKVNAQFIDKLSQLHPDLSKNEQRLASLLRIGLSTKEIASVKDSTPKTVNMARYRLRKHLSLETDESLTEYMKSI